MVGGAICPPIEYVWATTSTGELVPTMGAPILMEANKKHEEKKVENSITHIRHRGVIGDPVNCEIFRNGGWIQYCGIIESFYDNGFILSNKENGIRWSCDPSRTDARNFRFSTKGGIMMDSLKQYITKHRDIFFTIGFILVLDHFVFGGAFKKKLEDFIHSILDRQIKTAKVVDGQ